MDISLEPSAVQRSSPFTDAEEWRCHECRFPNESRHTKCEICGTPKQKCLLTRSRPSPNSLLRNAEEWRCYECRFPNESRHKKCEICGTLKPEQLLILSRSSPTPPLVRHSRPSSKENCYNQSNSTGSRHTRRRSSSSNSSEKNHSNRSESVSSPRIQRRSSSCFPSDENRCISSEDDTKQKATQSGKCFSLF